MAVDLTHIHAIVFGDFSRFRQNRALIYHIYLRLTRLSLHSQRALQVLSRGSEISRRREMTRHVIRHLWDTSTTRFL